MTTGLKKCESIYLQSFFISAMGIQLSGTSLGFAEEIQPLMETARNQRGTEPSNLIEVERLKMDLAEKLMKKKQVDLETSRR